jgi:phage gp29-like protein
MNIGNTALMPGMMMGKRSEVGKIDWTPPNNGQYPVRHVDTFINRYTSLSNTYRDHDEALLDSRDNARYMRNDLGIRECLDSRQRSVALLNWHIDPEDEKSQSQQEFCGMLEDVVRSISHFYEYRRNVQHAIWYGKYGIQHRWGVKVIKGKSVYMPIGKHQDDWGWRPLHGDKIVFRQLRADANLPAGSYEGQMGIRVGYRYQPGDVINNRWKVEPTDYGLAYFLTPAERRLILVHKHHIEDASYDDGQRAGAIYGVGLRSVIYWEWVQQKSTLAFLMEFLGRMAGGIQVWKYPSGNPQAREEVQKAAENYNSEAEHVLLVPVPPGDIGQYGVEVIDPGFQGIDVIQNLLTNYYSHRVKRYILGQILTSEAEATGMGSGVAELHADTLLQILESDALNHGETMRSDLLMPLIQVNVRRGVWADPGFTPKFVVETEESDIDAKGRVWGEWADRGLAIKETDLYDLIGAARPNPGDAVFASSKGASGDPGGPPEAGMPPDGQQDPTNPQPPQPDARDAAEAREPDKAMQPKPQPEQTTRYRREPYKRSAIARIWGFKQ